MKKKLQDVKAMQDSLRRKAQVNEYMYALLRENGIAARLDENIGIDFINLNRTSRVLAMPYHRCSSALTDNSACEVRSDVQDERPESASSMDSEEMS